MKRARRFLLLAVLLPLALAVVPNRPAYAARLQISPDSDFYISSPGAACVGGTPAKVTLDEDGFTVTDGTFTVSNNSAGATTVWVRFNVQTTTDLKTYWMPVTLNGGQSAEYTVTSQVSVLTVDISTCTDSAVGIVESPDPVVNVAPAPRD